MTIEKLSHPEVAPRHERSGRRMGQLAINAAAAQEERSEAHQVPHHYTSHQLELSDFKYLYPPEKIHRDSAYVGRTEARFEHDPDAGKLAKAFEHIIVNGIQVGRWLGNVSPANEGEDFRTQTFEATRYDDLSHRIDAFSTLTFAEPLETSSDIEITQLPLAFDVTLQIDRAKVLDKLTRCYNDGKQLPFGFSSLDYYTDGHIQSRLPLIPRYVIGVNGEEVQALSAQFDRRSPSGTPQVNMLSPDMLYMRFKVLAEIRAQNELFEAMLPDDAYDSENPMLQKAIAYIEAADMQLNHALGICTRELIARKCVPSEVLDYVKQRPDSSSARKALEDALIKKAHEHFIEEGVEQSKRRHEIFDFHTTDDDPFVQIITLTRALTQATYDDDRRAALDSHRRISAHNHNFEIPK